MADRNDRKKPAFIAGVLISMLAGCSAPEPGADVATLAVTGARVWTADEEQPWAEAVAVHGDRIIAVGTGPEIAALVGDETTVVDADGGMLVPGFIDSHVHFFGGGSALASVQLRDAETKQEFTRRIAEFAANAEPGEWITGGMWDHTNWGGELPRRDWIDALTPENPVWVKRLDGHMALANSVALKKAGVDSETPDVAGGEIVRDTGGRPTGILKDNAMGLVVNVLPDPTERQLDAQLEAAMAYVAGNGVTSVHGMYDGTMDMWTALDTYERAEEDGRLITRIYSVVPLTDWEQMASHIEKNGRGSDWFKTGGVKGFMDGSLGSHTAAFIEPYTDAPDEKGFLLHPLDDLREWMIAADAAGLQLNIHAIGDRAIRELLDIFDDVQKANGPRDRRLRMEHAQHIHPDDILRFAIQNVIASMQPYHAIDDGRWADEVIGEERAKSTYAFKSLLDSGAKLAFGSDWYVAPATPLEGIYAAVTRRTIDGANPDGWVPQQKISVEQALRAYTVDAAYAAFDEDVKGALKPGMLADMVLLDRDITSVDPVDIAEARIEKTIVGGDIVFSRVED